MTALPSDIAAALRPWITASIENAGIKARFPSARDNSAAPAEGFFDILDDARAAAASRSNLIGALRRRFAVQVADEVTITPGTVPTHRLIDAEQGIDAPSLVARIEIDLEQERSTVEYFG